MCLGIEILERHPLDLFRDVPAEHIGYFHRDTGHYITLDVTEDKAQDIQSDQDQGYAPDISKVNGRAGRMHGLGHHAFKQFGCGLAQQFRAQYPEHCTGDRENQHGDQRHAVRRKVFDEGFHCLSKALRFFTTHSRHMSTAGTTHRAAHSSAGSPRTECRCAFIFVRSVIWLIH